VCDIIDVGRNSEHVAHIRTLIFTPTMLQHADKLPKTLSTALQLPHKLTKLLSNLPL
jgi:hypothetical protein